MHPDQLSLFGETPWQAFQQWKQKDGARHVLQDMHRMASRYARRFLRRASYGLENPSREYRAFRDGAGRALALLQKQTAVPDLPAMIEHVLNALEQSLAGRPAWPAMVASDATWTNLLPQYFRGILG